MTTLSEIQTIFKNIVEQIAPIDNIVLNDFVKNTPKPNTFLRISILSINDLMVKPIREVTEIGLVKEIFLKNISFSVNCYSPNPIQYLYDLQNRLQTTKTAQILNSFNVALRDKGSPKNIPVIEGNETLAHANMMPSFDFSDEIIDDIGYFDKVELKGDFMGIHTYQIITQ